MYDDGLWFQTLASGQLTASALTCLRFDAHEEAVWCGTSDGFVCQISVPDLERVSSARAHAGALVDIRSLGGACLSLSARGLLAHATGGAIHQSIRVQVGCVDWVLFQSAVHGCAVLAG